MESREEVAARVCQNIKGAIESIAMQSVMEELKATQERVTPLVRTVVAERLDDIKQLVDKTLSSIIKSDEANALIDALIARIVSELRAAISQVKVQ